MSNPLTGQKHNMTQFDVKAYICAVSLNLTPTEYLNMFASPLFLLDCQGLKEQTTAVNYRAISTAPHKSGFYRRKLRKKALVKRKP